MPGIKQRLSRRAALLALAAPWAGARKAAATGGRREIYIDAGKGRGRIRSLHGVNASPAFFPAGAGEVAEAYTRLRLEAVRVRVFTEPAERDANAPDSSSAIFPDWQADAGNPESYHFGPADQFLRALAGAGAHICFQLGRWGAAPHADLEKFAAVAQHIARHYNAGWASGFEFDVRDWEIGSEADRPGGWQGTPEQFYALYHKTAQALKADDRELRVGGCGLADASAQGPYREGLLRYCAANGVPLDFFSWQHDSSPGQDPYEVVGVAQRMRRLLDQNGFENAESHLTAWGPSSSGDSRRPQGSMAAAAFTTSVLIYLQEAPVEAAYFGGGESKSGLFDREGRPRKEGLALLTVAQMLDTPLRLAVDGADQAGYGVLAGRSFDGGRVQVLVSDYRRNGQEDVSGGQNDQGYDLLIENLPWGTAEFKVERYRISEDQDFAMAGEGAGRGGSLRLVKSLPAPAIELIVLEPHELPLYEKLPRRRRPRRSVPPSDPPARR